MDHSFYIFAPDGGFFYNGSQKYMWLVFRRKPGEARHSEICDRNIQDEELNNWMEKAEVSKWLWGAYGPGEENYVFTYLDTNGNPQGCQSAIFIVLAFPPS